MGTVRSRVFTDDVLMLEEERAMLNDRYATRRNANVPLTGMSFYLTKQERLYVSHMFEMFAHEIATKIPKLSQWYKNEVEGLHYTHKIRTGGFDLPYCGGFNCITLVQRDKLLMVDTVVGVAKHIEVVRDHIHDWCWLLSLERTGAVGMNFADLVFAVYYRHDPALPSAAHERERVLSQVLQGFIYKFQKPTRFLYQSLFVNYLLSFGLPEDLLSSIDVYYAARRVGTGIDYVDELAKVFKYTLEIYLRGDESGAPLTFPIPSIYYTDTFIKLVEEYELDDLFWKVIARRGSFYLMNPRVSDPRSAFSFCCRLKIDLSEMKVGRWVILTGSVGYGTVNLPRLAFLARGEPEKAIELLWNVAEPLMYFIQYLRERYLKFYRLGFYPATAWLIDDYPEFRKDPFQYYYNTLAVTGLAEYASIIVLMNNDKLPREQRDLARVRVGDTYFITAWRVPDWSVLNELVREMERIVKACLEVKKHMSTRFGVLHNLELAPAEEAGFVLASRDYAIRDMRVYVPIGLDDGKVFPFYTSQIVPYYSNVPLWTKIEIESRISRLFDGGVATFIDVDMYLEPERVRKLVHEIMTTTDIVYLAYSPVQARCLKCGWSGIGYYDRCPNCGSTYIDNYQRIVGYYSKTSRWNPGRRAELMYRLSAARSWISQM